MLNIGVHHRQYYVVGGRLVQREIYSRQYDSGEQLPLEVHRGYESIRTLMFADVPNLPP